MSKIEEALKKAKESRGTNITTIRSADDVNVKKSNAKGLVVSKERQAVAEINRKSSVKEIALMKEEEILENKQLSELKIIFSEMPDSKIANTYRDLRTKLIQKSQGKNFITMVTSCSPGIDSSSVALNLSTAFSFDESKTSLLIDCDLNNPKLDKLLDMEADKGLTDYLENENIDIDTILHKTGVRRLRMIPAGTQRETATEFFTSLRMRDLMSDLLSRYSDRYIFIDSAPISDSADTRILVELCDFVLLVVPYGKVTKNKIKEAAEAIGTDKLLGIVFNDIPKLPNFRLPGFGRSKA
jgi:protein-tyrosine kinase